jgi:CDP-glycerol glycerophosphotransferase (TagB/SpsB family)
MTTILFESHHLYYLPHFEPIIAELKRRGGYEIAASIPLTVATDERRLFAESAQKLGVEIISDRDEKERVAKLRQREFNAIVVGNVGRVEAIAAENSVVVMVYHGIGLKQSYYTDISPRVNLRAVESKSRFGELEEKGQINLVLTGLTKLDPLAGVAETARDNLLRKWNLDPDLPTVLYAPTFYPSSLEKLLSELPTLADQTNVLIKLHNFSWYQKRYRFQIEMASEVANGCKGLVLLPPEEFHITKFYPVTDILLSDLSSTLFEFLALNRPIIQTEFYTPKPRHRIFPWRLSRRLDSERASEIDFTHFLNRPSNLLPVINHVLEYPHEMASAREAAVERYLYKIDGQASSRLVDAIEAKLKERDSG